MLALLGTIAFPAPGDAARSPYEPGEKVRLTGVVTNASGEPIEDLEVVLEAARLGLHVGPFGKAPREVVRGSTRTDAKGQFSLQWNWNPRFDRYELIVAVPVQGPGGPDLHALSRTDITRRVLQGSPIAVPTVIEDTKFLETLRTFLASLDTADEKRVYGEMGRPAKVESIEYPDRVETSWWYFERGKVFRFVDGRLTGTDTFDPVEPL